MNARLAIFTDLERFGDPSDSLEQLCPRAVPGSVLVVLRDRHAPLRTRWELGSRLRVLTRATEQLFFVSDRVDLALALDADGVHLPAGGLLPSQVRCLFPGALVSRAHHDVDTLAATELDLLAAIFVSPAFAQRKGRPALGESGLGRRLTALRELAPRARLLALGGLDAANAAVALSGGADGVAAISAAHDPAQQGELLGAVGAQRR